MADNKELIQKIKELEKQLKAKEKELKAKDKQLKAQKKKYDRELKLIQQKKIVRNLQARTSYQIRKQKRLYERAHEVALISGFNIGKQSPPNIMARGSYKGLTKFQKVKAQTTRAKTHLKLQKINTKTQLKNISTQLSNSTKNYITAAMQSLTDRNATKDEILLKINQWQEKINDLQSKVALTNDRFQQLNLQAIINEYVKGIDMLWHLTKQ